jgi:hypothetical protein
MVGSPEPVGSGAQTLAAAGAAGGKNLAAAGGGEAGAEAVTALAHQFAGLISPLHGFFSADRAICLLELRAGSVGANRPEPGPFSAQNEPPGQTGHHGQLDAAYTGPTAFRQSGAMPGQSSPKSAISCNIKASQLPRLSRCLDYPEYIESSGVFEGEDGGSPAPM